ncbi:ATP-binding protein [Streptomyces sp. NPDC092296]|uniref:ATP-binding protein n=1 Tax=Streptomyces sp. NPDC092296 TaxID=3366012 RepID=UPI00381FF1EC
MQGPSLQAGTVYGGIHLGTAQPRDAQQPWQLPPAIRIAGRAAETAALEQLRDQAEQSSGQALIAVSGLGGVGKTVLVLSWLHSNRSRFPDGQLYADLGGNGTAGPVAPDEILGSFLRALGVPSERIPRTAGERAGLYRSLTAGRRLAVLLDDAFTAAQVRPLLPSGRSVAVVTSRWRLTGLSVDGFSALHLEPMGVDEAVELLAVTLDDDRVDRELAEARTLVNLCSGLPLAVRVAGARLAARPQRAITTMVRALAEERDRLDVLAIRGDHAVRATLDLSYRALPEPAARLYRGLGLHPGPHFGAGVAATVLAADPGQGDPVDWLDLLIDASLLSDDGGDRYRLHDLVRLHATAQAAADPPEVRAAVRRRILDHYLASATRAEEILDPHHRSLPRELGPDPVTADFGDDSAGALAWLEAERSNLMAAVHCARRDGFPATAWQLVDAMWPLFVRRKYYADWRAAHLDGLAAAEVCGDPAAVARMLTSGGLGELGAGGHVAALEMFSRAAEILRETGDGLGFARTFNYRGLAFRRLGRSAEAIRCFERAAEECAQYGDVRGAALARLNLAETALAPEHPQRADAAAAEAQAAAAQAVLSAEQDPYNAARAGVLLGRALLCLGRYDAAEAHLDQAHAELRRMTAGREVAKALETLGELAERRGQPELARTRYEEAALLYGELGAPGAAAARARLDRLGGPLRPGT